jgi:hypothetical protein
VIYNLTGLQQKTVFINRPTAQVHPDVEANQRCLGEPSHFGRDGFSRDINTEMAGPKPKEPRLASFRRFDPPTPAPSVPQAEDIDGLFIFGRTVPAQLARDVTEEVSDYHLSLDVVGQVLRHITDGARIILLTGVTCDGKTLILNDLLLRLATERPVYGPKQHYETLLNEVASILEHAPDAALAIENCFDISSERPASIAAQFDGQNRVLLLTGRSISSEASSAGLEALEKFDNFQHIPIPILNETEATALVDLVYRFAGWRKFWAGNQKARRKYIIKTCEGSPPRFLLQMLNSTYVRNRYIEEFSKISLDIAWIQTSSATVDLKASNTTKDTSASRIQLVRALKPALVLANYLCFRFESQKASSVSFEMSTPMVSFICLFLTSSCHASPKPHVSFPLAGRRCWHR